MVVSSASRKVGRWLCGLCGVLPPAGTDSEPPRQRLKVVIVADICIQQQSSVTSKAPKCTVNIRFNNGVLAGADMSADG